jgi:hypothetical protein
MKGEVIEKSKGSGDKVKKPKGAKGSKADDCDPYTEECYCDDDCEENDKGEKGKTRKGHGKTSKGDKMNGPKGKNRRIRRALYGV